MSQKSTTQNSKKKDGLGKFILHFFMFSSLINGTMCNLNRDLSKDFNVLTVQRTDDAGKVSQVFCHTENTTAQNRNELSDHASHKALSCKFSKNVEKDNLKFDQRTFRWKHRILGQRKRLQFALLPIMYKMGVMTTLLTGLTFLAFKGLTIGVILLIFAFGNHFAKYQKYAPEQPQPIHVHVHSQDKKYSHYETEISPVSGWSSRIDAPPRSVNPYFHNNGENTARLFLSQTNKLKTFQFYH